MKWETLISFKNLWQAYRKAARGKRSQPEVADFEMRLVDNLFALQDELRSGEYYPGGYRNFYVREAKRRLISAAPFRDRVVHHALVRQLEPVYERKFIFDTYANRTGKGTQRIISKFKSENILLTIQKHSGRTSEILVFDRLYQIIR